MMYLLFSLAALFLTACADSDNPVVYTAPAGKAVTDEEDEEVKQPPGTNYGSYEEIPYVPADRPETAAQTQGNEGTNSQTSSNKLVGNSGESRSSETDFENDYRQNFTTGPNVLSWKLTAVKLYMRARGETEHIVEPLVYTVEIWTRDTDDTLMEKIGTLTNPSSLVDDALNEFTGDIDLAANTTYALMVDVSGGATRSTTLISITSTGAEDGDSMPGWSIADYLYWRDRDETVYSTADHWTKIGGHSFSMEIYGYATSISTQSQIDAHTTSSLPAPGPDDWYKEAWDTRDPTLRGSLEREYRYEQLAEDGVLPTLSVSGCKDADNNAIFTFSRTPPLPRMSPLHSMCLAGSMRALESPQDSARAMPVMSGMEDRSVRVTWRC